MFVLKVKILGISCENFDGKVKVYTQTHSQTKDLVCRGYNKENDTYMHRHKFYTV